MSRVRRCCRECLDPLAEPFDLDVLGAVADDYEAVHTIRGDLERDLGRSISVEELSSTLVSLVELGFVDAFTFDAALGNYRKIGLASQSPNELWFFISKVGRVEYERLVA
jgi:hypothetical protein